MAAVLQFLASSLGVVRKTTSQKDDPLHLFLHPPVCLPARMTPRASSAAPARLYFGDPQELPGPLPTLGEIEAAETTLPYIWPPADNESHALMVLQKIPTIPKLYAMYCHEGKLFLVMQYLPGKPLDVLWGDMSEHEKTDVTQQLHDTVARVRALPPPSPPVFGNVAGGPVAPLLYDT